MLLTIGERLKAIREFRGLKGIALAKACDIPVATINAIERGRTKNPGIEQLKKLADQLEVTIDYLADDREVSVAAALPRESLEVFLRSHRGLSEELQQKLHSIAQLPFAPTSVREWQNSIEFSRYLGVETIG